MPQVTSPNEFYPIVTEGPSAQYVVPSALHNLPATVSASSNVTSSVILANGFSAISVALTSTQAGTLTVQRYVDTAGTETQGAPVAATLVASTLAVINVNDGLPFQSFTVNVANSSGSSATLSGVQVLLQSETATGPFPNPNNIINGAATATDSSSHTLIAAQGSGVRSYITTITVGNSSSTGAIVTITDGTSTLYVPAPPSNSGAVVTLPVPFRSAANTAVTFQSNQAVSTLYISAQGYKGA